MAEPLTICLVCPYALAGSHPVAEYVRNEATALAGRGHRVTVLAPSASSRALRSGRRAAAGAGRPATPRRCSALPGEPLAVAVGPAVPLGQRRPAGRRAAGCRHANVALAVGEGGFDIVHAHEPHRARHWHGGAAAHPRADRGHLPHRDRARRQLSDPGRPPRERYRARIDALMATSPRAAELAGALYPGEYQLMPDPRRRPQFRPGRASGRHRWWPSGRADGRAGGAGADPAGRRPTRRGADAGVGPPRPPADAPARARPRRAAACTRSARTATTPVPRCWPRPTVFVSARGGDAAAGLGGAAHAGVRGGVARRAAGPGATPPTSRRWRRPPPRALLDDGALRERWLRARGRAAAERGREAMAERLESHLPRLMRRRRRSRGRGAAGTADADRRRPAHAHQPLARLRDRPRGAARPLHRARAWARSPSPTTTRSPARWRRRRAGQADHGDRGRGGEDLAGRGDRAVPDTRRSSAD